MKIAMISEHASPLAAVGGVDAGGQNVHVAQLALALGRAGRGDTVTVYTRRDDPALPARVPLGPNVEVVHVDAGPACYVPRDELLPHISALGKGVAADWEQHRPDVVHGHFWMSGLAALDASGRLLEVAGERVPVVQTFHALGTVKRRHQGAADTSPEERDWLEPHVGRLADAIVATCTDEVFELKAMGIDTAKVSIAPCGVDVDAFTPLGAAERRAAKHTVAVIGRMVPRKGVDTVIAALARMRSRGIDDVELLVVGGPEASGRRLLDDPEIARLAQVATAAGVGDLVRFRGRVPREALGTVIRSVDLVVCTPWYEPFGMVPLEAMACGVPVVASAVGGLIDTVVDGTTGVLVPPGDVGELARVIDALVRDPRRRAAMGRAGRERATARYTWDHVAEKVAGVYRQTAAALETGDRLVGQLGG